MSTTHAHKYSIADELHQVAADNGWRATNVHGGTVYTRDGHVLRVDTRVLTLNFDGETVRREGFASLAHHAVAILND
ncbi:hypothetical protein BI081_gp179 [Mycobacterium phage Tonenili]|uniref:Uncharacterized protein n=1 Tax=Mycobacterium phage Tonenili TaxID=1891703 RepID=A0A1C9EHF0_9CAUD|nr:hypothetical protein BI081_gp179 [Mycobacterium phage Tonenili]AON96928.1 hypothetical protein SEA_TONENILI_208 [Mycobacterium phage Tonenili]